MTAHSRFSGAFCFQIVCSLHPHKFQYPRYFRSHTTNVCIYLCMDVEFPIPKCSDFKCSSKNYSIVSIIYLCANKMFIPMIHWHENIQLLWTSVSSSLKWVLDQMGFQCQDFLFYICQLYPGFSI